MDPRQVSSRSASVAGEVATSPQGLSPPNGIDGAAPLAADSVGRMLQLVQNPDVVRSFKQTLNTRYLMSGVERLIRATGAPQGPQPHAEKGRPSRRGIRWIAALGFGAGSSLLATHPEVVSHLLSAL
jgi:hypothetical protein